MSQSEESRRERIYCYTCGKSSDKPEGDTLFCPAIVPLQDFDGNAVTGDDGRIVEDTCMSEFVEIIEEDDIDTPDEHMGQEHEGHLDPLPFFHDRSPQGDFGGNVAYGRVEFTRTGPGSVRVVHSWSGPGRQNATEQQREGSQGNDPFTGNPLLPGFASMLHNIMGLQNPPQGSQAGEGRQTPGLSQEGRNNHTHEWEGPRRQPRFQYHTELRGDPFFGYFQDFLDGIAGPSGHTRQHTHPDHDDPHDPNAQGRNFPNPSQGPAGASMTLVDLLHTMLNGRSAAHGDGVYTQAAFDDIITQLMAQHQAGNAPGPASEEAIASLPKKKATAEMLGDTGRADCSICMDSVGLGDEITVLYCGHWFHGSCIGAWLKEHDTCPFCRKGIMEAKADPANACRAEEQSTSRVRDFQTEALTPTPEDSRRLEERRREEEQRMLEEAMRNEFLDSRAGASAAAAEQNRQESGVDRSPAANAAMAAQSRYYAQPACGERDTTPDPRIPGSWISPSRSPLPTRDAAESEERRSFLPIWVPSEQQQQHSGLIGSNNPYRYRDNGAQDSGSQREGSGESNGSSIGDRVRSFFGGERRG